MEASALNQADFNIQLHSCTLLESLSAVSPGRQSLIKSRIMSASWWEADVESSYSEKFNYSRPPAVNFEYRGVSVAS